MNEEKKIRTERWKLLIRIERILDGPMIFLGFAWLILLILELTRGLSPAMEKFSLAIWIIFIIDFFISLILAPDKKLFLKKNVLIILSLIIPAIRILRIFRLLRFLRGLRLVRVLGSLNSTMRNLSLTMSKRGFGYMVLLTVFVVLIGAAGMHAFEKEVLNTYGESLWWTSMVILTIGSEYWPKSPEGRILCYVLALYGFAVLGYITATLATFFIGQDASETRNQKIAELKNEIIELKKIMEKKE